MQFRTAIVEIDAALVFASAVQAVATPPTPELSCQACEWFGGQDSCCSASCIAQHKAYHGGYCDSRTLVIPK
jgi:hypothetical protein